MINSVAQDDQALESFERGIDRNAPRTRVPKGGYESATNVLLRSDDSGKHVSSALADAVMDPLVTWPSGNPVWFAPFTYPVYNATTKVLSYVTQLVIMRDNGQMHTYTAPASGSGAGSCLNVRRGFVGTNLQVNHFIYDKWLCTTDGRNAPMKYGQHLLWSGQLEPTPFMFPLGSEPVTPFVPSLAGETWTLIGSSMFNPDGVVPLGARIGSHALLIRANQRAEVAFSPAKNFDNGPQPYGGDSWASTDSLVLSFIAAVDGHHTGTVTVRFETDTTNYYLFTFTPSADKTAWVTKTILRSVAEAAKVGAPSWSNITKVRFFNNDLAMDVYVDDCYFLYASAPPAAAVGTSHKNRIILGGAPVGSTPGEPYLSTLVYSKSGGPDNYPSANTQPISGGTESLAKTNAINALREYADTVIIGCPSSIFSWTVGESGNPVKSTISTEQGIDSHRGIVETPQGSLLFPWQRGFYILRSTGRQYIAAKIAPLLANMHLNDPSWTMSVVDDKTKTVRFCWREGDAPTKTSNGIVFDHVGAQELGEPVFTGLTTQLFDWAVPAYVSGNRETLYCKSGDPQIYRMHITRTGSDLESTWVSPWMARHVDKLTKWMGIAVPYVADAPITVSVRYADVPGQFNSAEYMDDQILEANPQIDTNGRVQCSGTSKWAQFRFVCAGYMELYPPLTPYTFDTLRPQ